MADLLEDSSAWLAGMNRRYRGRSVVYARAGTSAEVTATVGKTAFEVPSDYGIPETLETRDYLIAVSDLAAFGEPAPGDQVQETLNGQVEIFEVMAPASQPHFVFSDPYRQTFRIHTKHVGTCPP